MKIKVYYQNGRIVEHNTEQFCNMEPFRNSGINIDTEFDLRSDLLETHGLFLIIYWNNYGGENPHAEKFYDNLNDIDLPYADRKQGAVIQLIAKRELEDIIKVVVDGEMTIWQQDNTHINGVKFANQEIICFSDATTTSINKRAIKIFRYLKKANPDLSDDEVAGLLGYSFSTLATIIANEAANVNDENIE